MTTPMEANGYIWAYERESDPDDFAGIETSTGPDPQLTTQEEWEEHMDAQQVDIKRLSELHTATTQGEWKARQFEGMTGGTTVEPEMTLDDWRSCCELHNAWPAVAARLAILEEFAQKFGTRTVTKTRDGDRPR